MAENKLLLCFSLFGFSPSSPGKRHRQDLVLLVFSFDIGFGLLVFVGSGLVGFHWDKYDFKRTMLFKENRS